MIDERHEWMTDLNKNQPGSAAPADAFWCCDRRGDPLTFQAYLDAVAGFHGHLAPGLVLGGKMVESARSRLPEGVLFDAVSETGNCLPDAVQLLTPCTVGNGWLQVLSLGRFALCLYDKTNGRGYRVALDPAKLAAWPEIDTWFFKRKPKPEQNTARLITEIQRAGEGIYRIEPVQVQPAVVEKRQLGPKTLCPVCGESYPAAQGPLCSACQGDSPYLADAAALPASAPPGLKVIPLENAAGRRALHDMTEIIPGGPKAPAVSKGEIITEADLCRLQRMGRMGIYTADAVDPGPEWVHENDAAAAFAAGMAGDNVAFQTPPKEGRITFQAKCGGLLVVDIDRLEQFNRVPGVMCASRRTYSLVQAGHKLAGTRAIPLYLDRRYFQAAAGVLAAGPLFRVMPLRKARTAVLITGTEVFRGWIQDRFQPIIRRKVEALGSDVIDVRIVPDDRARIRAAVQAQLAAGADLIITTAGLSVDPDDVTRQGLIDAGAQDLLYGMPILPGAMTLLAHIGNVQLIGVPACALHFAHTSLDLLLPRLLAGAAVTRADLARAGHGAFCLECAQCRFPDCTFGA